MHGPAAAAALALACALAGAEGGGKGGAAPPAPSDLKMVRSERDDWEFQAPAGFTEETPKKADIVKQVMYAGPPYLSTKIKVYSYEGYTKPEHIEGFMKFFEKSIGGNVTYEEDSKSRFTSDLQFSGTWWISQVEGRIAYGRAYAVECLVPKDVYDATRDVWIAVSDSFKPLPPPTDTFTVPTGWTQVKAVLGDMCAVMGPLSEVKDKKARDLLDRRLAQVKLLLEPDRPSMKMFRIVLNDERKAFPKCPVHVLPTTEGFKALAGDRWTEGATAVYLPDHAERVLVVDGSPDGGFAEDALLAAAGEQYAETRLGRLPPWLRAALRLYFVNGIAKGSVAGLFPPEALKRAKEVFAKTPAAFDDLAKRDEAGMAALGDDGRVAAWGLFQYGLHGPDGPTRNVFRAFLRDGVGAADLQAVWEKCLARHKEETKKVFKTKDLDAGAKKFFRDFKEDKK